MARWPGPGPGPGRGAVARGLVRVPALLPPALAMSCPAGAGPGPGPGPGPRLSVLLVWFWWRWPGPSRWLRPFAAASILSGPGGWVPVKRIIYAVGTVIRQKQEPNGCQSQLLDSQFGCSLLRMSLLTALFARCVLPGTVPNHPTSRLCSNDNKNNGTVWRKRSPN